MAKHGSFAYGEMLTAADYNSHIRETETPNPKRKKHYCEYHHGESFDDERGNCSACGAPREEKRMTLSVYAVCSTSEHIT